MELREDMLAGMWKFDDSRVSHKDVVALAEEWAKNDDYLFLFIRGASKDQTGLGFVYKYDGTEKTKHSYHENTTHELKMRFGNGLVGWDYSTDPVFIKGFNLSE